MKKREIQELKVGDRVVLKVSATGRTGTIVGIDPVGLFGAGGFVVECTTGVWPTGNNTMRVDGHSIKRKLPPL